MSARTVQQPFTGNRQIDQIARDAQKAIAVFANSAIGNGVLLTGFPDNQGNISLGIVFSAGQTRYLAHNLGRPAKGFVEVAAASIPSAASCGLYSVALPAGVTSETTIAVKATSAGTCYVWVFG